MRYLFTALALALGAGAASAEGDKPGSVEAQIKALCARVETLEKQTKALRDANHILLMNRLTPPCDDIPDCGCGCMETGSCKCRNCADRTADPKYKKKAAATPRPRAVLAKDGTEIELHPDGLWRPVAAPRK